MMSKTNLPGLTAEASLYKTSGHYQTHRGRKAVSSSAQMVSPIYPAIINVGDEVIHVHGCPPGFTNIGGSCWPIPLSEPPVGGGGGEDLPPGGGPEDGGPYGQGNGKGKGGKTLLERVGGRYCKPEDFPGGRDKRDKAEQDCAKKSTKAIQRQLVCFDNPDGTVSPSCCYVYLKNKGKSREIDHVICIHAEEVPPK